MVGEGGQSTLLENGTETRMLKGGPESFLSAQLKVMWIHPETRVKDKVIELQFVKSMDLRQYVR